MAEAQLDLKQSLKDLLDVSGEKPSLALLPSVAATLQENEPKQRAMLRVASIFDNLRDELSVADWFSSGWLEEVIGKIELNFEQACERWRGLYRAALMQRNQQNQIIGDASRSQKDRDQAKRLRSEAETQIDLLLQASSNLQSDFYSYRYFAGEGFLPGYNFPRLPLSAYIPGSRGKNGRKEFVSRPRFLAISEFGPGSFIYHEGSRYVINRVIVSVEDEEELASGRIKQCPECAYIHPVTEGDGADLCELCGTRLDPPLAQLFRLRNVSTRRRDRISSDEEERTRFGYTLRTGYRFSEHGGQSSFRLAEVKSRDEKLLATLRYGHTASIWRINLGWANRSEGSPPGFLLNVEKGMWTKEGTTNAEENLHDPEADRVQRVVPFVEDRKNCLQVIPEGTLTKEAVLSLVAALKSSIQRTYQLEDFELTAEAMPAGESPQVILFYESAEGGAGVLRRLVEDPRAMARIAREALSLCHFDPDTGQDHKHAPQAKEECVAACYDCLMSYSNQRDHLELDRHLIQPFLTELMSGKVMTAPTSDSRAVHLEKMKKACDSKLERQWLDFINSKNLRLPSHAQKYFESCKTRPDFFYASDLLAVYVDGPHHEYSDRQERDLAQTECMEDLGITVVRFGLDEQWQAMIDKYPHVFGRQS